MWSVPFSFVPSTSEAPFWSGSQCLVLWNTAEHGSYKALKHSNDSQNRRSWLRAINAPEMVIISKQWHATTSNSLRLARTMSWQGRILDPSEHRKRERDIRTFVHVTHIWYMICYLYYIQKGSVFCAFYCSKLHKASYAPPERMELCTGKAVRQVQKSRNTVWRWEKRTNCIMNLQIRHI